MTGECKQYVANKLSAVGVDEVYLTAEEAQRHRTLPYAIVSASPDYLSQLERLEYRPARVAMEDDPAAGVRRVRWRTHIRRLVLRVAIAHRTEAEAQACMTAFLRSLDRRFLDAEGNAVLVRAETASYSEEQSLLHSQAGVEATVLFEGGVYRDEEIPLFKVPDVLVLEPETVEEV